MEKRRVLVLCAQTLFGEGLDFVLSGLEGVEVIGPWAPGAHVLARLSEEDPDIVLVAEEEHESRPSWTTRILEQCPGLPVIQIGRGENGVRLYTPQPQVLPAHVADIIEAVQKLSIPHK